MTSVFPTGAKALSTFQSLNAYSGRAIFFVLLLPFFYYSSALFWQFVYPEGFSSVVIRAVPEEKRVNKQAARSWNWFRDTTPVPVAPKATASKLDAKLVGVIATGTGTGVAMIQVKRKQTEIYRVGDEVANAVFLESIHVDRVTLRRDDQFEVLALARLSKTKVEEPKITTTPKPEQRAATRPKKKLKADDIAQYKKLIREKPIRLIELIEFQPHQDTEHGIGFKLSPREEEHQVLFDGLGLHTGDVLLSANEAKGEKLVTSPKTWKSLLRAKQIKLKVLRGGVVEEVTIDK